MGYNFFAFGQDFKVMKINSKQRKKIRRLKRNAIIICQNETQFWTTQAQFWQWFREHKIKKIKDNPLTGKLIFPDEESMVILKNMVLNLAHPNHLSEVLSARRYMKQK